MAEGKGRHDWAQTSWVLAMLYNANRGADAPVRDAESFNPYLQNRTREPDFTLDTKDAMKLLKKVWGDGS